MSCAVFYRTGTNKIQSYKGGLSVKACVYHTLSECLYNGNLSSFCNIKFDRYSRGKAPVGEQGSLPVQVIQQAKILNNLQNYCLGHKQIRVISRFCE